MSMENIKKKYVEAFNKIENATITNNKLYRFCSIKDETEKQRIFDHITTQKLFFASPESFNDPFDCILLKQDDLKKTKTSELSKLVTEYDFIRIRSFNNLDYSFTKNGTFNGDNTDDKRIKNIMNFNLMFAHYGNYHDGILIEYEYNSDNLKNKDCRLIKVNYKEERNLYNILTNNDTGNLENALGVKSDIWDYEHECRFVFGNDKGKKATNEDFMIPLNDLGLTIKKVIFGIKNRDTISERDKFIDRIYKHKDCKLESFNYEKTFKPDIVLYNQTLNINNNQIIFYQAQIDNDAGYFGFQFDMLNLLDKGGKSDLSISGDDVKRNISEVKKDIKQIYKDIAKLNT